MKINNILFVIFSIFFTLIWTPVNSIEIVRDSFESGDMSAPNQTAPNNFEWENNNGTSVVTQHITDGSVAIYNNKPIYNIHAPLMPDKSKRNWLALEGKNSLRFRYAAGKNWTEQRFNLGNNAHTELWIAYWLRVPTNFSYGTSNSRQNNKFLAIWMDGYETKGSGSTVWLGMMPTNNTDVVLEFSYSQGDNTGSGGFQQQKPFIVTSDQGRWMHLILHVKSESTEDADDGVIETYRRWENENKYTKLHEMLNAGIRIPDIGAKGFNRGYILGWANQPYDTDTEWLLDDFAISDSPPASLFALKPSIPASPTNVKVVN